MDGAVRRGGGVGEDFYFTVTLQCMAGGRWRAME